MDKHWLITYQQREYGREEWITANCATSKSPAEWLIEAMAETTLSATVLLFAIEITDKERQLLQENI